MSPSPAPSPGKKSPPTAAPSPAASSPSPAPAPPAPAPSPASGATPHPPIPEPPPARRPTSSRGLPQLPARQEEPEEFTGLTVVEGLPGTAPPQLGRRSRELGAEEDEPTGLHELMLVTAVAQTDKGRRRKTNEDSYLSLVEHGLFLVADGMGGHLAGEVASQLTAQTISELFRGEQLPESTATDIPPRAGQLLHAIEAANEVVFRQGQSDGNLHGMGTTVVAACFSRSRRRLFVAHAGDSRCYRLRDQGLKQLTRDHTIGEATGAGGSLGDRLTRALGIAPTISADLLIDAPLANDLYLLCSDGLSKMLPDDELRALLLEASDLPACAQSLVDAANSRGGKDNITVVLVRVLAPSA
ncbi:MAG: protein phosphatase 2C domain-containing protein [Polyangiaceae bacterium]|nr:protein phosphatase 2C domain-containing protein [Polyangiaceae bacterium]